MESLRPQLPPLELIESDDESNLSTGRCNSEYSLNTEYENNTTTPRITYLPILNLVRPIPLRQNYAINLTDTDSPISERNTNIPLTSFTTNNSFQTLTQNTLPIDSLNISSNNTTSPPTTPSAIILAAQNIELIFSQEEDTGNRSQEAITEDRLQEEATESLIYCCSRVFSSCFDNPNKILPNDHDI